MTPADLVSRFYGAFARGDAAGMAHCYHRLATFEDPVFGPLDQAAACAMWAMLLSRSPDLVITPRVLLEPGPTVRVQWEARYTFTRTGRSVRNRVQATFRVEHGLILSHRDHFSLWAWARQAFGATGLLLGWTPWFQARLRREALRALADYRMRTSGAC